MKRGAYAFVVALLIGSSCQKDDVQQNDSNSCFGTAAVTGKADQYVGYVRFIAEEKRYALVYTVPGSIDSQVYGVVCNLPEAFRQEGKRVKFSGTYHKYDGPAKPIIGGQTYEYLALAIIEAAGN